MFCPSCGNEITVELKYCNRCGANLTLNYNSLPATVSTPIKLTAPTVVLGLTIIVWTGNHFRRRDRTGEDGCSSCFYYLDCFV